MLIRLSQAIACLSFTTAVQCLTMPNLSGSGAKPEIKGKRSTEVVDGVEHTIFEHEATGAKLDFVTNSGICETTPGVNQYSGYLSVGSRYFLASLGEGSAYLYFRKPKYVVLVFRVSTQPTYSSVSTLAEWWTWMFFNDRSLPGTLYTSFCRS